MAANLTVTAPVIVVTNPDEGTQHYLHRGAAVPDWVSKDQVKQLRDLALVEAARARKAPAPKQDSDDPSGNPDETKS